MSHGASADAAAGVPLWVVGLVLGMVIAGVAGVAGWYVWRRRLHLNSDGDSEISLGSGDEVNVDVFTVTPSGPAGSTEAVTDLTSTWQPADTIW